MTERQKAEALKLQAQGRRYKEIGEQIGATTKSVKQFFYRNGSTSTSLWCNVNSAIK